MKFAMDLAMVMAKQCMSSQHKHVSCQMDNDIIKKADGENPSRRKQLKSVKTH